MRFPYKIGLIALVLVSALGLPHISFATTVYQQLTDSSQLISGGHSPAIQVATFISPSTVTFSSSAYVYATVESLVLVSPPFNQLGFVISISPSVAGAVASFYETAPPIDGAVHFDQINITAGSGNTLIAGTTYYILFDTVDNTNSIRVNTNLSKNFLYGYVVDDGNPSVPIAPGIPGFTDVGISTTSQQVFCNSNFSTSSGLLSNLGQSISLGFCNVSTFLFVPSSGAISSWQNLATTTTARIPFSYMYEVFNDVKGMTASSSDNFINVSLDMSGWASSSIVTLPQQWVVLSTSTVSQYYPTPIRVLFRSLMATVLYLGFALWVYRKGQRALHSPV